MRKVSLIAILLVPFISYSQERYKWYGNERQDYKVDIMKKIFLIIVLFFIVSNITSCGKGENKCKEESEAFDECIHNKADIKFNDQEIIDYFFSAKEGSWWAFKTNATDPIYGTAVTIYDTLRLRHYNHYLETTLDDTRELYGIFYYFKNNFWVGDANIKEVAWDIFVTAEKKDVYTFDGAIGGRGKGLGAIYKYNNSYYTGHTDFGATEDFLFEYEKYNALTVNGKTYNKVWSNYIEGRSDSTEHFICYFAKNVGLIKMINFHGKKGFESALIDYHIEN